MRWRCDIEADSSSDDATYGNSSDPDWTAHLEDVPCHYWYSSDQEITDAEKLAVLEAGKLIVPLGTDVSEVGYRIKEIRDRLGNVIFSDPMGIEGCGRRADHLELTLEAVS